MTYSEIAKINTMRKKGWGYKRIAGELNISPNNVKSYLKRHPEIEDLDCRCDYCGKVLTNSGMTPKKRFCSDNCRMAWWKKNPSKMKHNTLYSHVCRFCGSSFETPRKDTQFCNRACYANYRRKETAI